MKLRIGASTNWVPELWTRQTRVLFFTSLIVLFASKGQAFLPGYAFDDFVASDAHVPVRHFLSQGRFSSAAIFWVLKAINTPAALVYWPALLLLFPVLAASITLGIAYVVGKQGRLYTLALAVGLASSYPYLTEYFTFRMVALPLLTGFGGLLVFLACASLQDFRDGPPQPMRTSLVLYGALGLLVATGSFQHIFLLACIFCIGAVVATRWGEDGRGWRATFALNKASLLMLLMTAVSYALIFSLIKLLVAVGGDSRAEVLGFSAIYTRFIEFGALARKILFGSEPLVSAIAKATVAIIIGAYLVLAVRRHPMQTLATVLAALILVVVAVAFVLLGKTWWPVPRAIFPLGFSLAVVVALLGRYVAPPTWLRVLGLASIGLLCLHSSAILSDQLRLNRWDMNKAALISRDILAHPEFSPSRSVVLVGGSWRHEISLRTTDGDLNASVFIADWGVGGLFREATGLAWSRLGAATEHHACDHQKWPQQGAIKLSGEAIVVCL